MTLFTSIRALHYPVCTCLARVKVLGTGVSVVQTSGVFCGLSILSKMG